LSGPITLSGHITRSSGQGWSPPPPTNRAAFPNRNPRRGSTTIACQQALQAGVLWTVSERASAHQPQQRPSGHPGCFILLVNDEPIPSGPIGLCSYSSRGCRQTPGALMEIFRRICADVHRHPQFKTAIDTLQFPYRYTDDLVGQMVYFDISENHPLWPQIRELATRYDAFCALAVRVQYSKADIAGAAWLSIGITRHAGYPQPEDHFQYQVYDADGYCDRCGIHPTQSAPFRFRSELQGRDSFRQLNWVFDEFFVTPEVSELFADAGVTGVEYGPCIHHSSGRRLESLSQLVIPNVLPAGLTTTELNRVTCKSNNEEGPVKAYGGRLRYPPDYPYCGRVKYHWPLLGQTTYAAEIFGDAPDIVKSHEWFGSGGSASREILVSQKVCRLIIDHKLRGLSFVPVVLEGST
jgi:hypothetical protein